MKTNSGICLATNAAIALSKGDFVVFLDHDDVLAPDALYRLAEAIREDPQADIFYSDRDMISVHGQRFMHLLKPAWSPETLLSGNYLFHMAAYRRSLLNQLGRLRLGYEGSQDYDLILRASEVTNNIRHIPRVLYHWRAHAGSMAIDHETKSYIFEVGKAALSDAFRRRGFPDTVTDVIHRWKGNYRGYPTPPPAEQFSVLRMPASVSPNNYAEWLHESICWHGAGKKYFVVVGNGLRHPDNATIAELVSWLTLQRVGFTTGRIIDSDGKLVHAGLVHRPDGIPLSVYQGFPIDDPGYMAVAATLRNVSGPHPWCFAFRKEVWDVLNGVTPAFSGPHVILDFALRALAEHWRTVYVAYADFTETKTQYCIDPWLPNEAALFRRVWHDWLAAGDPYYPVGLTTDRGYVSLEAISPPVSR